MKDSLTIEEWAVRELNDAAREASFGPNVEPISSAARAADQTAFYKKTPPKSR
jgi:hypothetical protein